MTIDNLVIEDVDALGTFEEGGAKKFTARLSFSSNPSGGYVTGGIDLDGAVAGWGIPRVEQVEDLTVMQSNAVPVPIVGEWRSSTQTLRLWRQQNGNEVVNGQNLASFQFELTFVGPRVGGFQ